MNNKRRLGKTDIIVSEIGLGGFQLGEKIIIESIIGTTFSVKVDRALRYGKYNAIIPEINGEAYITGRNTFWLNPDDPLKDGFIIK